MDIQVGEMRSGAIDGKRFAQVGMRDTESSGVIRGHPERDMRFPRQLRIARLPGQPQQLLAQPVSLRMFRPQREIGTQPDQRREQL
ncbi:hypothetical protein D9M68_453690 [compost metagenome]